MFLCRLILDTLCCGLGLSAGAEGAFVSYLAAAGAGGGFDQFVADPEPQQFAVDVDITAGAGVMAADANLLPGHAHHAVGAHPAADPVCAAAVSLAASRHADQRHRGLGCDESLGRGGHVQGLVWPRGVVIVHPLVKSLLGRLQVLEWGCVTEELSAQTAVESLNFARRRRRPGLGQQMLDPILATDRIEKHLDGGGQNRPVNTLPLSVKICSGAP